jgi:hypothetical protein
MPRSRWGDCISRSMTKLLLVLAAGIPVSAQVISLGVKAGALLTDPVNFRGPFSSVETTRFTGGPSIEVHLPFRLSVEADALYQTHRHSTLLTANFNAIPDVPNQSFIFTSQTKTRSWQVPILLKYTIIGGPVRPFIGAGVAWQREWSEVQNISTCVSGACNSGGSFRTTSSDRWGPAAGAGVAFSTRYFTVAPEVRYTRLNDPNQNEVRALVGFSWGK